MHPPKREYSNTSTVCRSGGVAGGMRLWQLRFDVDERHHAGIITMRGHGLIPFITVQLDRRIRQSDDCGCPRVRLARSSGAYSVRLGNRTIEANSLKDLLRRIILVAESQWPGTIERLAEWAAPREPDLILGAEARGYITGGALACRLGCGFVPARKPGKLPWHTVAAKYALEYGFDQLEVHADAIQPGQRVLVHDDVLATGGTAKATAELVEQLGGIVVGLPFIIELTFLEGRKKLDDYGVFSLIQYSS